MNVRFGNLQRSSQQAHQAESAYSLLGNDAQQSREVPKDRTANDMILKSSSRCLTVAATVGRIWPVQSDRFMTWTNLQPV